MFDIGWSEMFIVVAVLIVVVGPKDLPRVLAQLTKYIRKARSIAREFQGSIDEVVRQVEVDDIRKEVEKAAGLNLENEIRNAVDPTGEISRDLDLTGPQSELDRTVAALDDDKKEAAGPPIAPEAPATASESLSAGPDGVVAETRPDDPTHPVTG